MNLIRIVFLIQKIHKLIIINNFNICNHNQEQIIFIIIKLMMDRNYIGDNIRVLIYYNNKEDFQEI